MVRALLFCLLALAAQNHAPPPAVPDPAQFGQRFWEALRLDYEVQQGFTYIERRRDVKISRLGKVTVGPLRTFEVFPSSQAGGTYKRLIAVDGQPLPAAELARRDAERTRDLETDARRGGDNAYDRRRRDEEAAEAERRRRDLLADAAAVFETSAIRLETIDDAPVFVADIKPRASARVRTREGNWMKRFAGRLWVAAADYQLVRLDMRAFDDINIGWGVVGHIDRNSRVYYTRRRFEHAWLPAELTYEITGRTLLFRSFQVNTTTTFSDYKRR